MTSDVAGWNLPWRGLDCASTELVRIIQLAYPQSAPPFSSKLGKEVRSYCPAKSKGLEKID
jgi:hypothetical protein